MEKIYLVIASEMGENDRVLKAFLTASGASDYIDEVEREYIENYETETYEGSDLYISEIPFDNK